MSHKKKLKFVISDFHLSAGKWLADGRRNPLEDFHEDDRMAELLKHYSTGDYADYDVELIVNGDFFDLLAVMKGPISSKGKFTVEYPEEVEEGAAVEKFRTIVRGHPICINAMKEFLKAGKKLTLRWGNHDAALLWPAAQAYLRETLDPPRPEQLEFQQKPYIFDRVFVDHGHQYEVINQFDESKMFFERKTKKGVQKLQNLPFGSFFVLGFLNKVKLKRSYINLVYPFRVYVHLMFFFDPWFFWVGGLKSVWFFFKMRFITHPTRFIRLRKTLLIAAEMFSRPSLEEAAEELLRVGKNEDPGFDTVIMGHNHQAASRVFHGGKLYLNTGTWTPITSLQMSTLGHHMLRTYALIEYRDGKPVPSLKIWNGPSRLTEDFR